MTPLQRRLYSLLLASSVILGGHAALAAPYEPIEPPVTADVAADRVEVVELFWYGCPHCYRLLPLMERWLEEKPDGVTFRRVPAILRPEWALHARAYYVADALGEIDRIHGPLFDAIHLGRQPLNSENALEAFFVDQGVSRERFRAAWRSFAVETKVRQARALTRRYGITGTPAIVINGKYRTDSGMAGSYANLMRTLDELVARESAPGGN